METGKGLKIGDVVQLNAKCHAHGLEHALMIVVQVNEDGAIGWLKGPTDEGYYQAELEEMELMGLGAFVPERVVSEAVGTRAGGQTTLCRAI